MGKTCRTGSLCYAGSNTALDYSAAMFCVIIQTMMMMMMVMMMKAGSYKLKS
jgi:hypothetical protein